MNPLLELPIHIKNMSALTVLGIAHSKITEIPSQIVQLGNLKQIFVENTPLQVPKLVTAERGVKAIQEFFNDQIQLQKQLKKKSREDDAAILIKTGGKQLDMNESSDDDEDSVNIITSHESEHDEDNSDNDMG